MPGFWTTEIEYAIRELIQPDPVTVGLAQSINFRIGENRYFMRIQSIGHDNYSVTLSFSNIGKTNFVLFYIQADRDLFIDAIIKSLKTHFIESIMNT